MLISAKKYTIGAMLAMMMLPTLWSCSDDDFFGSNGQGTLTVELALPQSRTDSEDAAGEYATTSDPTANECKINDLRLIAFPQGGEGHLLNTPMSLPASVGTSPSASVQVSGITPGRYKVYIVANMAGAVAAVKSEAELRAVMMEYSATQLPQAGNLPMIYEPQSETVVADKTASLMASLEIACVKVSLNVIFDKASSSGAASTFGDKGLRFTSAKAYQVSSKTTLVNSGTVYSSSFDYTLSGQHYSVFNRTDANAQILNRDVMSGFSGAATPTDPNAKWCYHTTIYLPERYVTTDNSQTFVELEGEIFGAGGAVGSANATNVYRINLGHVIDGKRQLPRDTYYEVVGEVETLGTMNLNTFTSIKTWSVEAMDAKIRHTLLSVDKTRATVKSLEPATITYSSSAAAVTCSCVDKLNGNDVIIATQDVSTKTFTLKINPAITISSLTPAQQTGTVKVAVKANNLTKYIDVDYDITPFFEVDETTHSIFWNGTPSNKVVATITTNLGGVNMRTMADVSLGNGTTITNGATGLKLQYIEQGGGVWTLEMTATANPGTTTAIPFRVGPASSYYNTYKTDMLVYIKPQNTTYRIYMRAINNRLQGDWPGGEIFAGILSEYDVAGAAVDSNNWKDGWSSDNKLNSNMHRCYFYYQFGETAGTGLIPDDQVWRFSSAWPGDAMTGDTQNPGWYYKDYSTSQKGTNVKSGNVDANRGIVPGEALLIFYCNQDVVQGIPESNWVGTSRHRFSAHMAPGISLFDYEDLEGWYLFDPLCEPEFRVYDDKPIIEDVTYSIYTKGTVYEWYHAYGVSDQTDLSQQYYVKVLNPTCVSAGGGWYKTTLQFKCPKGEYEKAIKLNITGVGTGKMLFGGNSWTTGYYDGTRWYKGKPSGATI